MSEEAKSILKPIFDEYMKHLEAQHHDKVVEYYDPDATLVIVGKKGIYGKEAIKHEIAELDKAMGKAKNKFIGQNYYMAGDFIIMSTDYETTTEKMGLLKGKFTQIWRKSKNSYLILHDEFSM